MKAIITAFLFLFSLGGFSQSDTIDFIHWDDSGASWQQYDDSGYLHVFHSLDSTVIFNLKPEKHFIVLGYAHSYIGGDCYLSTIDLDLVDSNGDEVLNYDTSALTITNPVNGLPENPLFLYRVNPCEFYKVVYSYEFNEIGGGNASCDETMQSNLIIMPYEFGGEYNCGVNLSLVSERSLGLKVYPNPCQGVLYLKGEYENIDLRVIDIGGSLVLHEDSFNSSSGSIDLSGLPDGFYVVELKDNDGFFQREKILVSS